MAAQTDKIGTRDDREINLTAPYEILDWMKALACTRAELRTAVRAVGKSEAKVRQYLKNHKR